jgi:hypothetical protein
MSSKTTTTNHCVVLALAGSMENNHFIILSQKEQRGEIVLGNYFSVTARLLYLLIVLILSVLKGRSEN